VEPEKAAHFLMRLLFCLFADSIGLLPENLFRQMLTLDKGKPASFTRKLRQLFAAMSTSGSNFGMYDIHYFNGGLFADDGRPRRSDASYSSNHPKVVVQLLMKHRIVDLSLYAPRNRVMREESWRSALN
jgi:hypothetical protein